MPRQVVVSTQILTKIASVVFESENIMKLVQDEEINALTHAFNKLAKLQNGKINRLKNPQVFQGTYEQLLKDFNMFLPKGKMIVWKEEDPLVKKKRKLAMFKSRVQDLGSQTYTEFCRALEILETRSKTPTEVYTMVVELFEGRGDLILDFEKFCGDLLMDSKKVLNLPLIDDLVDTKITSQPMRRRKFGDRPIQANRCASKKGHVEKVLEPKADMVEVSPTPPSKGRPMQGVSKDEVPKSTSDKDLMILPLRIICNVVESPQSKRVVRKRLGTDRPTSEELEKRFNKLWKTCRKEDSYEFFH